VLECVSECAPLRKVFSGEAGSCSGRQAFLLRAILSQLRKQLSFSNQTVPPRGFNSGWCSEGAQTMSSLFRVRRIFIAYSSLLREEGVLVLVSFLPFFSLLPPPVIEALKLVHVVSIHSSYYDSPCSESSCLFLDYRIMFINFLLLYSYDFV
jgi:hypothetical protein